MTVHRKFRFVSVLAAATLAAISSVAIAEDSAPTEEQDLVVKEMRLARPANVTMEAVTAFDLWTESTDPLEPVTEDDAATANAAEACTDCYVSFGCESTCDSSVWVDADMLLWWLKGNNVPSLVTTSPDGTARPDAGVLGAPGTTVLHGGSGIDGNNRFGLRATVGCWLNECQTTGFEVTWFSLGDGSNSGNFRAESVGTPLSPILARPFYDVALGQQNSELVAFPDVIEGSVEVLTSSEMHSVAALIRRNWKRDCDTRVDFLGGYRYLRYREGLAITENLTSTDPGGVVAIGTEIDVYDRFATENDFHGLELGMSVAMDRGRWSLDAAGKVAFGNMHQQIAIDGMTVVTVPGGSPTPSSGGLLALSSNIGRRSQDSFAMIPEMDLNLRYQLSCRTSLTLGYSLMWITNVARSGDQIDFGINTSQMPANGGNVTGAARPAVLMKDTSMWAQGLNLGVVWQY